MIDTQLIVRKVSDPFNSGWPDCEYIPPEKKNTKYVEYKLIKRAKPPASIKPDLSEQQRVRLRQLYANQPGNVLVVVGVMLGAGNYAICVFKSPLEWENNSPTTYFASQLEYAIWLVDYSNERVKGNGENGPTDSR